MPDNAPDVRDRRELAAARMSYWIGKLDAARQNLIERVMHDLAPPPMPENQPRLIVVAGPNGSGKTTLTDGYLKGTWAKDFICINPDAIAFNDFGSYSTEAFLQAARKSVQLREQCIAERKNFLFETVMSTQNKVKFIKHAQKRGYFVTLFFVCTDHPDINVIRVALRVAQGGHDVPEEKIRSRYQKSIQNCILLAKHVNLLYLMDNTKINIGPRLVSSIIDGKIQTKIEPVYSWTWDILKSLE